MDPQLFASLTVAPVLTKPSKHNRLDSVGLSHQHLGGRVGLLEGANLVLDKLSQGSRRGAVLAQVESDFSEYCGHFCVGVWIDVRISNLCTLLAALYDNIRILKFVIGQSAVSVVVGSILARDEWVDD